MSQPTNHCAPSRRRGPPLAHGRPGWSLSQQPLVAFTVTVTHPAPGCTVVDPAGELDLLTSPTLDKYLDHEVRDPRYPRLTLNLSHLEFCGAAGLTSLLRARDLAHATGTHLHLVGGPLVDRLLHLTGLGEEFATCADLSTAGLTVVVAGRHVARSPVSMSPHPRRAELRRV